VGLVLLVAMGCHGKVFYLPAVDRQEASWPQEGGTADGRAFVDLELEPPLQLLWQQNIDAQAQGGMRFSGNLVLQLTNGPSLYGFDRFSGRLLGKRGADTEICAPLALVDDVLVYAELGKNPQLRAFDRRTLDERWDYPGVVCAPPIGRHDTLLVAGEEGKVSLLRGTSGEELWHKKVGKRLRTAPSMGEDVIYLGTADGSLVALDLDSGEERWKQALESGVRTRAVVGEDLVFVGTAAGVVYALQPDSGQVVWQTNLGALLTPGMALAPQALVVGSVDRSIYGLNLETGEILWQFETEGVVRSTPAATARTVFCGSSDGYLYALENATGQLLWKYRVDGPILAPVALGESVVGITSENKTLYVFGRL
jgi:outer membrane protein assembly factor BamB